jgi:hypothetical protein
MSTQRLSVQRRPIHFESPVKIMGWPLVAIARGKRTKEGSEIASARGIVAVGDVATGVFAVGGVATGVVAVGGIAAGAIAVGGLACGMVALGGLAIGAVAKGGVAIGQFVRGGSMLGMYVMQRQGRGLESRLHQFGRSLARTARRLSHRAESALQRARW